MTVHEVTLDLLRSLGMTTIFGNPGSTELPMLSNLPADFRYVLGLQEAVVVGMADGFAQSTRTAAFVSVHSAAGLGNALGNIYTAFENQTPLVITAGQQSRPLLPHYPYLYAPDAAEFPRPWVKWSHEPARGEDVPAALERAWHIAMQRPSGPVFLSIPLDDWRAEATLRQPRAATFDYAPDPKQLARVAEALNRSERPAFIVGPAVDRDNVWNELVAVAERARAAVWSSPMSPRACFPEEHPLFAGFLPPAPGPLADILNRYDFVLVLGAPVFTYHVPGEVRVDSRRVYLITDDTEAAARAPAALTVLGSMRLTLPVLLEQTRLEQTSTTTRTAPEPWVRPAEPERRDPITGELALATLRRLMPDNAVLVEEAPSHRKAMRDFFPIRQAGGFHDGASGGLGFGMPAAVGMALAQKGRPIVCLIGDGSAMYSIQALWTAAQLKARVTFVVLNNASYAVMKSLAMVLKTPNPAGVELPGLDFVAIARGMGCAADRVTQCADLEGGLTRALGADGPFLLEVVVDPAFGVPYGLKI
jgi:benzoylformate decarboxylase